MTTIVDPKVAAAVLAANPPRYGSSYIGAADTAKLIRSALKLALPGVPFRVRSDNYSGGCSVNVSWTDGPTKADVDRILSGIVGKHFDGSIDLAYSSDCYIDPATGLIGFAGTDGTAGSGGYVRRAYGDGPAGSTLVTFAPYISTDRDSSPAARKAAVDALRALYGPDFDDDSRLISGGWDHWAHSGRGLVSRWIHDNALPVAPAPRY